MYLPTHYALVVVFVILGESGILFIYTLIGLIKSNPLPYMIPPQMNLAPQPSCQCVIASPASPESKVNSYPLVPLSPENSQPLVITAVVTVSTTVFITATDTSTIETSQTSSSTSSTSSSSSSTTTSSTSTSHSLTSQPSSSTASTSLSIGLSTGSTTVLDGVAHVPVVETVQPSGPPLAHTTTWEIAWVSAVRSAT